MINCRSPFSSSSKILNTNMSVNDFPDECWESVFRFLGHHHLDSLSEVCKQFHSITNRLQCSLTIYDQTIPFLQRLFQRFSMLKTLDFSHLNGHHQDLLLQISQSGLDLHFLDLSNQRTLPLDGLRQLGSKMTHLKVLICSNVGSLRDGHLIVMAYCFPLLEELDISFPFDSQVSDFGVQRLSSMLEKLRKINISGNHLITDKSLFSLCHNCLSLKDISFFTCFKITQIGIASAIRLRPGLNSVSFNIEKKRIHGPSLTATPIDIELINSFKSLKSLAAIDLSNSVISDEFLFAVAEGAGILLKKLILQGCCNCTFLGISSVLSKCESVQCLDLSKVDFLTDQCIGELSAFVHGLNSINLSGCCQLTNLTFFTLTRNCPLLSEIRMERTYVGVEEEENVMPDSFVNLEVKKLYLGDNALLNDASLIKFASICPNLEVLDLTGCEGVSGECIVEVLKICCEIRHLNLANTGVKVFEIDFEVSKVEVLNLSGSSIEDETLSMISKRFSGLLVLDIQNCLHVTTKGVGEVVDNCRALKELNLKNCRLVSDNFVAAVALVRPSLRTIVAPDDVGV